MTTYEIDTPLQGVADTAPVGLVAKHSNSTRLVRTFAGWSSTDGVFYHPGQAMTDGLVIERLPDEPPLTFTQFVQQFKTTTIGASYANSIRIDHVRGALRAIGCDDIETPLSPGMVVHYHDNDLLPSVPNGTIARHGVGSMWEVQSWYVRRGSTWHHMFGPLTVNAHDLLTLHLVPGVERQPWVDEAYDPAMDAEIEAFKERAWELGLKAKSTHDWCGQYEVAMARLGMTKAWAERPKPMTAAVVSALPLFTALIGYDVRTPGEFAIWRRVDDSGNEWGVERMMGTIEDDYPSDSIGLVRSGQWLETEPAVTNLTFEIMDSLPVASTVRVGGYTWTRLDGGWSVNARRPDRSDLRTTANTFNLSVERTLTRLGSGVYRMFSVVQADAIEHEPVGVTLQWYDGDQQFRLAVRDESGGVSVIAENGDVSSLDAVIVGEPGEMPIISSWVMLDHLPIGSVVSSSDGATSWTRRVRGWTAGYGRSSSRDFRVHCQEGRLVLRSVGEDSGDPRIGSAVTQEMVDSNALPLGTSIYGTRSERTYTVVSGGLSRNDRSTITAWVDMSNGIRSGLLIIETIPTDAPTEVEPVEPVALSHHGFSVDERLNADQDMDLVDALPNGSQIYTLVERRLRTKVDGGWMTEGGSLTASVTALTPRNVVIHALGALDGSGEIAVVSDKEPAEHRL